MFTIINEALLNKVETLRKTLEPINANLSEIEDTIATLDTVGKKSTYLDDERNRVIIERAKKSTATLMVKVTIGEDGEPTFEIVNDSVMVKERTTGVTTSAHQVTVDGKLYQSSSEAMKDRFPEDYKPGEDSAAKLFKMALLKRCTVAKGEVVIEGGVVIAGDITSLGNDKITKMFATENK